MKRSTKFEINSILSQIIIVGIVIISIMIAHQHSKTWDLTKNKVNTHAAAGRTRNEHTQNVQTVAHPKSNKRE